MSAQAPGHIHQNCSVSGYCVAREKAALTPPSSRRGRKKTHLALTRGRKRRENLQEATVASLYEFMVSGNHKNRICLTLDALADQFINRAVFNSYYPRLPFGSPIRPASFNCPPPSHDLWDQSDKQQIHQTWKQVSILMLALSPAPERKENKSSFV